MKFVKLQAAENMRVSLADARNAGRVARHLGQPFNDRAYGFGTLESREYAAGWRTADYDMCEAATA